MTTHTLFLPRDQDQDTAVCAQTGGALVAGSALIEARTESMGCAA